MQLGMAEMLYRGRGMLDLLEAAKRAPHFLDQQHGFGRGFQIASGARKKLETYLALQVGNQPTHRWLRYTEHAR